MKASAQAAPGTRNGAKFGMRGDAWMVVDRSIGICRSCPDDRRYRVAAVFGRLLEVCRHGSGYLGAGVRGVVPTILSSEESTRLARL